MVELLILATLYSISIIFGALGAKMFAAIGFLDLCWVAGINRKGGDGKGEGGKRDSGESESKDILKL
ncbi:MAG TPA: hypothetical protein VE130_04225 [Nitrososphaeraceae archaeon]|jgi:hypothetical protein|nr:hypothetical protein [Nitrososphaeraceae archaeon]